MFQVEQLIAAHERGRGLAQAFYMDPLVFERDMERVIRRHWHCVGHVGSIPNMGDFFVVAIEQESLVITRGGDGEVHALLNVCRHRGATVCTEVSGNTDFFVCPYHAWTYGLDGALAAARHMPNGFDTGAHGLRRFPVQVAEGLVFISMADRPLEFSAVAEALRMACGPYGLARARVAHREMYALAANWKLAVENYVECYHCAPAHPEYSKMHALEQPGERLAKLNARMAERALSLGVDIGETDRWVGSADGHEAVQSFRYALYEKVKTGSDDGAPVAPLMGSFTDWDGGVTAVHVGGTTFMALYNDHCVIYRFIPRTVDSSEMEVIWLVRGDAVEGVDYDRTRLTWLWKVTSEQDKAIIEHTAKGVRSRWFEPGPIAPMEHNELKYLDWYLEELRQVCVQGLHI